jgi:hypothetical protein
MDGTRTIEMLDAFRNETEQVIRRMVVLVADDDPSIRSLGGDTTLHD